MIGAAGSRARNDISHRKELIGYVDMRAMHDCAGLQVSNRVWRCWITSFTTADVGMILLLTYITYIGMLGTGYVTDNILIYLAYLSFRCSYIPRVGVDGDQAVRVIISYEIYEVYGIFPIYFREENSLSFYLPDGYLQRIAFEIEDHRFDRN